MKVFLRIVLIVLMAGASSAAEPVRFSRDILPLLSDRCFHCHGPDGSHREADLRLDLREEALADRDGSPVIVPGDPAAGELLNRITSTDPDVQMPPPSSHRKPFTSEEVELLKRWIAEGAPWGKHWAFEPPTRPEVPAGASHPIDAFVEQSLAAHQLQPAPEAPRHVLLRRLSFDLNGLPPTAAEVDAFSRDTRAEAYSEVVDRLLGSRRYGERMAMWWLDAARYSDTDGFQADATRQNWPWRDWVIDAFNRNQPFDQFTIEQFAGDLLPDAKPEQILATCFHRNHMTNGEGGREPEESRIDYVIDRVNTTGTVWLGLTLGCAQCHTHKFDPISHQDYYSLFAFFNSIDEDGRAGVNAKPYLKYRSPYTAETWSFSQALVSQRQQKLDAVLKQAEVEFEGWLLEKIAETRPGFQPWHMLRPHELRSTEGTILTEEGEAIIQASGPNPSRDDYLIAARSDLPRITALKLEIFPHASHVDGKLSRGGDGEFVLTDVKLQVRRRGQSQVQDLEIASAIADAEAELKPKEPGKIVDTLDDDPRNGWTTRSHDPHQPHVGIFALAEPLILDEDQELVFVMLQRSTVGDANIGRFRLSATDQPAPGIHSLKPMPLEQLVSAQIQSVQDLPQPLRKRLKEQFLSDYEPYQVAKKELDLATSQHSSLKKIQDELNVMVLAERENARKTFILQRGVWDQRGEEVSRAVPAAILPWEPAQTQTRLDLANWILSPENPLTARVIVNQLWQLCFGKGLVRTPEDFGLQGERPTHPELLDWLAVELVEKDWDIKHMLRLIVTSRTYRQDSRLTPELLERDPDNRLLARGARYRLPSWMIRDAALSTSGLLTDILGGPPMMPYQPEGVWEEMSMGKFSYKPTQGATQYRRTLYAFWRRSSAPTFLFDSAQRRVCEVRPQLTNTPLQALTLLNDQTLLEASRRLAQQSVRLGHNADQQIEYLVTAILSRKPEPGERAVLSRALQQAADYYTRNPEEARKLLEFGQPEREPECHPERVAPCLILASMIYNLDEAITHE
ncbi:PSD1 and planctomycete cytochrome C domain-containing protein [Planctomicrobium sp. SH664]|uniref:PSD1 and planctomycete cytochrome C domain-containing protein n=1 Tax=Planctomicrobium sp. SH664 TaxID=3448125 RepID=UPI003F5B5AD3